MKGWKAPGGHESPRRQQRKKEDLHSCRIWYLRDGAKLVASVHSSRIKKQSTELENFMGTSVNQSYS